MSLGPIVLTPVFLVWGSLLLGRLGAGRLGRVRPLGNSRASFPEWGTCAPRALGPESSERARWGQLDALPTLDAWGPLGAPWAQSGRWGNPIGQAHSGAMGAQGGRGWVNETTGRAWVERGRPMGMGGLGGPELGECL